MKKQLPSLPLEQYRSLIHLDDEFNKEREEAISTEERCQIVDSLLQVLLSEGSAYPTDEIPSDYPGKRRLLRALLDVREPKPLNETFLNSLGRILQAELADKGVVRVQELAPVTKLIQNSSLKNKNNLILWRGDITRLDSDAIVNAANSQLLGCMHALHPCIDNAIHTGAGPELRADCAEIMNTQGHPEQSGDAKITKAYHLPSKYVLHTVGPIVPKGTELTQKQINDLASCYLSCLVLAHEISEIKSIAFCSISTGVFGFPKPEAAQIALHTIDEWLSANNHHFEKIIFNVFSEEDYLIYLDALEK